MISLGYIYFLVFVFGTIIGSFLNVVIFRLNTGVSIFASGERSKCFSCGKTLGWRELIPILSFFLLRGRCLKCKSRISPQYPVVETITGIIFLLVFFKAVSIFQFVYWALIWSILIVVIFYDLRHKIIPDSLVYAFIIITFLGQFFPFFSNSTLSSAVFSVFPWASIITGIIFFCFFGGLWLVSGGRWLGFGDAKLSLGMGFFLGPVLGISAMVLSFWIGALVCIILLLSAWIGKNMRKHQSGLVPHSRLLGAVQNLTMKSEIPFAPFLILGTALAFFGNLDILGLRIIFGF